MPKFESLAVNTEEIKVTLNKETPLMPGLEGLAGPRKLIV